MIKKHKKYCLECKHDIEYIKYARMFCDKECRNKFNIREKLELKENISPANMRECKHCKTLFIWTPSKPNQIYCSRECPKKYAEEKRKTLLIKKYHEEERKCKFCKQLFLWISTKPNQIYCSRECSKNATIENYKNLTNGIIYSNGNSYNYYRLRFEIFKRDNFTCQYCGRNPKNDGCKLHIDHIHPKSKKGKWKEDNLITSCEECNEGKLDVLLEYRAFLKK